MFYGIIKNLLYNFIINFYFVSRGSMIRVSKYLGNLKLPLVMICSNKTFEIERIKI